LVSVYRRGHLKTLPAMVKYRENEENENEKS
jgi:hypothetical protein